MSVDGDCMHRYAAEVATPSSSRPSNPLETAIGPASLSTSSLLITDDCPRASSSPIKCHRTPQPAARSLQSTAITTSESVRGMVLREDKKAQEIMEGGEPMQETEATSEAAVAQSPGKKKRKRKSDESVPSGPKPAKRKKAKLEAFSSMPLDILHDILFHLDLGSLLSISRTSKQLRSFILEPSCKDIWDTAFESSGLPKLTAPGCDNLRYTALMFGKTCDFCLEQEPKTKKFRLDLLFRVRLCNDCWVHNTTKRVNWNYFEYVLKGSFDLGTRTFEFFLPDVARTSAILIQFDKEEKALEKAREDARMHLEDDEYEEEELEPIEPPGKAAYTRARKQMLAQRMDDDLAIRKWMEGQKQKEKDRKDVMRVSRRTDIESRLLADGWTDLHFSISDKWKRHALVSQVRPLNEKAWMSARPVLVSFLKDLSSAAELEVPPDPVVEKEEGEKSN